jgi:hypothetical protein
MDVQRTFEVSGRRDAGEERARAPPDLWIRHLADQAPHMTVTSWVWLAPVVEVTITVPPP